MEEMYAETTIFNDEQSEILLCCDNDVITMKILKICI